MSLKKKFIIFLSFLVILALFWSMLVYKLGHTQEKIQIVSQRYEAIFRFSNEIKLLTNKAFIDLFNELKTPNPHIGFNKNYFKSRREIKQFLIHWEKLFDRFEESELETRKALRKHYLKIKQEFQRLHGVFFQIIALARTSKKEIAIKLYYQEQSRVFIKHFSTKEQIFQKLRANQEKKLFKKYTYFQYLLIGSFLFFVPIIGICAVFLLQDLNQFLDNLQKGLKFIAKRELSRRLVVNSNNEFGKVAQTFNDMMQQLQQTTISKHYFENIIKSMSDILIVTDLNTQIQTVNQMATKLLQYQSSELIYKSIQFIFPVENFWQIWLEEALEKGFVTNIETSCVCRNKKRIPLLFSVSLITNEDKEKTGFVWVGQDITEIKKSEEEKEQLKISLQRAQKMEALGLLAGGVAHDLNNILSGIVSYPELLLMRLPKESDLYNSIKIIHESGKRATAVVSDLLTVARGVASVKEVFNLNLLICEYLNSPEHCELKNKKPQVTIHKHLESDLFNIKCSSIHIKKCLMNLVANAFEAIETHGEIKISTINQYIDKPIKGYDNICIGEYAVLSVTDTGSGIPKENMDRIFEPFYSKKVMARSGTGLGLSVVWNTVQDHNGYINVRSDKKETEFKLYFPISREKINIAINTSLNKYQGKNEKILVVDDEEMQRKIAKEMLETLEYNVVTISNGKDAIEYIKENLVDLLILDMIMPSNMNGRETYKRILEINPKQKAIIASGYSATEDIKETLKMGAGCYIKKPYTIEEISLAVRSELDK